MATQSLYRRYRPRRFSEVKGQEHVVRALRNAVINHREGQGYLFSGPRGTGKTTSARILAKVLNCENPVDGEPCCECDSCIAVERGTSYDVHELDAASNNGVDAMRDLIEKASLGTPGRHKVYILDEVHMLSKQAEAALLKTLEEPPPHVVFVLATTDPQKVSDTIRSRTQHLRFHLLPMDELEQHVRWVAADAGLEVSEAAVQTVLAQGGGSARDTLSALELIATSGGDDVETVQYGEFVEALIEFDPGRAITAVAHAVQQGRDPRALTEDLVRYLRDCFLSLMAPELVALPDQRAAEVADQAARLGAAKVVRAMERLGEMLVEMRHAPDTRLLLEVALVQLTHQQVGGDLAALSARVERLEQGGGGQGAGARPGGAAPVAPVTRPEPFDPATGRVQLGGRARRDGGPAAAPAVVAAPSPAVAPSPVVAAPIVSPDQTRPSDRPSTDAPPSPVQATETSPEHQPATPVPIHHVEPSPAPPVEPTPVASTPVAPAPVSAAPSAPAPSSADAARQAAADWASEIAPTLKSIVRAMFAGGKMVGVRDGAITFAMPNEMHRQKCEPYRKVVEAAITAHVGVAVPVVLVVDGNLSSHDDHDGGGHDADVVPIRAVSPPPADEDVDLSDLVDAPPGDVLSPIDRLAQAFPGSVIMDERS